MTLKPLLHESVKITTIPSQEKQEVGAAYALRLKELYRRLSNEYPHDYDTQLYLMRVERTLREIEELRSPLKEQVFVLRALAAHRRLHLARSPAVRQAA